MKEYRDVDWRELLERKDDFLHILRILNHYYENQSQTKNQLYLFRKELVERDPETIRIFLAKIGTYEYFVSASLSLDPNETETWIHVDGIAEEREKLKAIPNLDHPVFSLVCMSDLFESHTIEFKFIEENKKIVANRRKKIKL